MNLTHLNQSGEAHIIWDVTDRQRTGCEILVGTFVIKGGK